MGTPCSCVLNENLERELRLDSSQQINQYRVCGKALSLKSACRGYGVRKSLSAMAYLNYTPFKGKLESRVAPKVLQVEKQQGTTQEESIPKTLQPVIFDDGAIYVGNWDSRGRQHGKGLEIMPDGSKYTGSFKHGFKEGLGKLILTNGDFYKGMFLNNKAHGKGKLVACEGSCVYKGDFLSDLKSGKGEERWEKEGIYKGDWVKDKRHGEGEYIWENGCRFLGSFRKNNIEGKGTYYWSNGDFYEGDWLKGKMHGFGKFTWKDGRVFLGEYFKGKKNGYGEFYWPDGRFYKGEWVEGLQHGMGLCRLLDKKESSWKEFRAVWSKGKAQIKLSKHLKFSELTP